MKNKFVIVCLIIAYETLKEEKRRYGTSKTAEELESYIYGLTCAVDVVEKYVDKEE